MPPYAFVRNDRVVDPDVILTADAYPKKQDETVYAWDRKHTNENDIYWERAFGGVTERCRAPLSLRNVSRQS